VSTIKPSTTKEQQKRLIELWERDDAWIGYWCSDQWGRASNGGDQSERVEPGLVQQVEGRLEICPSPPDSVGLHATRQPHRWQGCRVWLVALLGEVKVRDSKAAAKTREIIAEVLPGEHIDPRVSARFNHTGHLRHADLWDANLRDADLRYANLRDANLRHADLWDANLRDADLRYANLRDADLRYANLRYANLRDADLRDTDLNRDTILPEYIDREEL